MDSNDQVFWLGFIGTVTALLGLSLKMCLKSKCNSIECCGLKINRDVQAEIEEEKLELEHNIESNKI